MSDTGLSGTELLVVGAGIAGAAVAYWAAQAGWQVTVVDAGPGTAASEVPSALLNPVRGQSGKVPARAAEGLALTWALIEQMETQGQLVPHGRTGVLRPVPDEATQQRFQRNLSGLEHSWWAPQEVPDLAPGWQAALFLPQGGWVDGAALCRALLNVSGARRVTGRVVAAEGSWVQLADGTRLAADALVWCGGSFGSDMRPEGQQPAQGHRAGTLLRLAQSPGPRPLSFGGYLAPAAVGGILGATFERPTAHWSAVQLPLSSLDWLLERGGRLRSLAGLEVSGQWSGTRLSGLRAGPADLGTAAPEQGRAGQWELTGLGSKGYLLGPLLARELVARITGEPARS
ncbi:FAD-binding oxidoreductase [Deinococcus sp. Marseille-Q6407]|uniref:FAD-binding oxidoreductase n=1 Tax=Deinococcus sp. Marseille-Q6407 TaxID=2969223 RepID=UPI0021C0CBD1|nr:FAD-binding oxidoreductase [Deinococcus sp. Marseille-Q6407]